MGTITRSFANNITSGGTFDATDLTGTIPASNIADASVTNITDVPALVLVSTVASDPPSPDTGQIWYNTTDKALRAYIQGADAWVTGGNLNTGRQDLGGSGGTDTTTGLAFAGRNTTPERVTNTESYNGSTWTELNDVNSAICLHGGAGTQTSALSFGGRLSPGPGAYVTQTESWDGTSWTTSPGNLNTARGYLAGVGADNTSVLAFGGYTGSPQAQTESWNGSAWTEVNDLNTGRYGIGGAGNHTAALGFGGSTPSYSAATESWNGTSWTEVNDLNTARSYIAGCGTQTVALSFGGLVDPTVTNLTESWNGTSWTEVNDLNLARDRFAGSGTASSALGFGGGPPGIINQAATEEFSPAIVTTDLGVS